MGREMRRWICRWGDGDGDDEVESEMRRQGGR